MNRLLDDFSPVDVFCFIHKEYSSILIMKMQEIFDSISALTKKKLGTKIVVPSFLIAGSP